MTARLVSSAASAACSVLVVPDRFQAGLRLFQRLFELFDVALISPSLPLGLPDRLGLLFDLLFLLPQPGIELAHLLEDLRFGDLPGPRLGQPGFRGLFQVQRIGAGLLLHGQCGCGAGKLPGFMDLLNPQRGHPPVIAFQTEGLAGFLQLAAFRRKRLPTLLEIEQLPVQFRELPFHGGHPVQPKGRLAKAFDPALQFRFPGPLFLQGGLQIPLFLIA